MAPLLQKLVSISLVFLVIYSTKEVRSEDTETVSATEAASDMEAAASPTATVGGAEELPDAFNGTIDGFEEYYDEMGEYFEPDEAKGLYDNCDLPYLGNKEALDISSDFARMGPNSKYFIMAGVSNVPISEVDVFCDGLTLQPADITNIYELIHIEHYLLEHAPPGVIVNLGANDLEEEGNYLEYRGAPMTFHSFAERHPNSKRGEENCVAMSFHPNIPRLVYVDTSCETLVTPICMFRPDHDCYYSSPLTTAKVDQGFQHIGASTERDYYVGSTQVPRATAAADCESLNLQLVDFSTGLNNNQMLYDLLQKWVMKNYFFPRIAFWTGGMISKSTEMLDERERSFMFQSSGKNLGDLSEWPSLYWDKDEPSDASGAGLEMCISTILYEPYTPSENNNFTLSTTNCLIPHFPICFGPKSTDPSSVEEETTEKMVKGRAMIESAPVDTTCPLTPIALNLTYDTLSVDEILELSKLNAQKPATLTADNYRFTWTNEKPWLSGFLGAMLSVGRKVIPAAAVPREFLNTIHNMMILYYNALGDIQEPSDVVKKKIEEVTELFKKCADERTPLLLGMIGGQVASLNISEVGPVQDKADGAGYDTDLILDSYWFYFLTAVGSCYPKAHGSKMQRLFEIHDIFVNNFIGMFEDRWLIVGSLARPAEHIYAVFIGDLELDLVFNNLRVSSVASFLNSGITDLYFPRPFYVPGDTMDTINEIL